MFEENSITFEVSENRENSHYAQKEIELGTDMD